MIECCFTDDEYELIKSLVLKELDLRFSYLQSSSDEDYDVCYSDYEFVLRLYKSF